MMRKLLQTAWGLPVMVASLLCGLYAVWLAQHIATPGLYYDEVLFVNAAVGGQGNEFISRRVFGIPLLLMEYIGALKSWIWSPIFLITGFSAASVRIPSICIGLIGSVLSAAAMGIWFGRATGLAAAILVAFDATIGIQSRLDWGPNAIMFACRGGFLLCAALASRGRGGFGSLVGMAVFVLFGLFDKLSFLWIALPGLLLFVLVERRSLAQHCRRSPRRLTVLAIATIAIVAIAMIRAVRSHLPPTSGLWSYRFEESARLVWQAVSGMGAVEFVRGGDAQRGFLVFPVVFGLLVAALLGSRTWPRVPADHRRSFAYLVLLALCVGLAFVATRSATGPHHAAVLAGLWQLPFVAISVSGLVCGWNRGQRFVPSCIVAALSVSWGGSVLMVKDRFDQLLQPPGNPNWDVANQQLAEHIAASAGNAFVFVDWGMGNQAIAATLGRSGRVFDYWPSFADRDAARKCIAHLRDAALYCCRTPGYETFPINRSNFYSAVRDANLEVFREKVFLNAHGEEMIEVIRLRAKSE